MLYKFGIIEHYISKCIKLKIYTLQRHTSTSSGWGQRVAFVLNEHGLKICFTQDLSFLKMTTLKNTYTSLVVSDRQILTY